MTSNHMCVIGVDGGNTKTVAVVADTSGRVLGTARGGCTDVYGALGEAGALAELDRVVAAALTASGRVIEDVTSGVFSLAGADWPEDHDLLRAHLGATLGPDLEPTVVNDAIGAIRLGGPAWEGVSVICGTGNAIGARTAAGATYHLGFWPDPIGAVALSQAALDAVYRDHLGLGPSTSLTARALEIYPVTDPLDLLHFFTRRGGAGRAEKVRMSEPLLSEADRGDEVARSLVNWAGDTLGSQAVHSAERVGLDPSGITVVLGGGLFDHPSNLLEERVSAHVPSADVIRPTAPPVVGAVLVALDQIGVRATIEAVEASLTPLTG